MIVISDSKKPVFEGQKRVQIFFDRDVDTEGKPTKLGPSRNRVKPEFLKASKIEEILKKATRTGMISVKPNAYYGDFTSSGDFLTAQNRVIRLQQYFDSLPSETRNWFANSPKNYLDFVLDPRNREQAIEMGLLPKPKGAPAPSEAEVRASADKAKAAAAAAEAAGVKADASAAAAKAAV